MKYEKIFNQGFDRFNFIPEVPWWRDAHPKLFNKTRSRQVVNGNEMGKCLVEGFPDMLPELESELGLEHGCTLSTGFLYFSFSRTHHGRRSKRRFKTTGTPTDRKPNERTSDRHT